MAAAVFYSSKEPLFCFTRGSEAALKLCEDVAGPCSCSDTMDHSEGDFWKRISVLSLRGMISNARLLSCVVPKVTACSYLSGESESFGTED